MGTTTLDHLRAWTGRQVRRGKGTTVEKTQHQDAPAHLGNLEPFGCSSRPP
jgi:hypothetical protein